jgi:hypothetical protein
MGSLFGGGSKGSSSPSYDIFSERNPPQQPSVTERYAGSLEEEGKGSTNNTLLTQGTNDMKTVSGVPDSQKLGSNTATQRTGY